LLGNYNSLRCGAGISAIKTIQILILYFDILDYVYT